MSLSFTEELPKTVNVATIGGDGTGTVNTVNIAVTTVEVTNDMVKAFQ